jgi:hypothetical protein
MHRHLITGVMGLQTFWGRSRNLPGKILLNIPLRGVVFHFHRVGFDSRGDKLGC